jgi:hypothetical protein
VPVVNLGIGLHLNLYKKSGGQICWQDALQTSICWLFLEVSCIESLVVGFLP